MPKILLPIFILITIIAFFFYLHPASGFIGGLMYYLIGDYIPSILNLLLSFYITFCLFHFNNNLLKGFVFLTVSFLLGLNTFLAFFVYGYSPKDVTVSIIKPLHKNRTDHLLLHFINENDYNIRAYPFAYNSYGSDEGCMCAYFIPPQGLFDANFWFNAFKLYGPVTYGLSPNVDTNKATYIIKQQYNLLPHYVLIKGEITDQMDGEILYTVKYPRWLLLYSGNYPRLTKDPDFWNHAWNILIHDNFWTWTIQKIFHPNIQPPFKYLPVESDNK